MITLSEEEYHIKFPKTKINWLDTELTFSINHVKSRELSTLYYCMAFYDENEELVYTYESDRWIIDSKYRHKEDTFTIPQEALDNSIDYQITLIAVGLSSENPLYFNEVMLQEGAFTSYHTPEEAAVNWEVKFNKNSFANLYSQGGVSLQVIRPLRDSFFTNKLTKSECTVLAPHLYDEAPIDNPNSLFLEFINQKEQRIGVLR